MVIEVFILSRGIGRTVSPCHRYGRWEPNLAHFTVGKWMIGVVAGLGGKIECDRQPGLTFGQVGSIKYSSLDALADECPE